MKHDIGVVGLAVMGENLALNIKSKGFSVAAYDRVPDVVKQFSEGNGQDKDITGFETVKDFVNALKSPRKMLMMIKAGEPVDTFIEQLLPHLDEGDIIIDGGNSNYNDTIRREKYLADKGLHFVGSGVSGGEKGALKGPSIMPGGSFEAWPHIEPIFMAISAKVEGTNCCTWVGPAGAGHFVKMVHNGIEYGDMQLISEAYHFMKTVLGMSNTEIQGTFIDWNNGDLDSYLIEITADILGFVDENGEPVLDKILDAARQKGTGKWTVNSGLDAGVPLSLVGESVFARCLSSFKELRTFAATQLIGPEYSFTGDREAILADLGRSLYGAKIISYTQGFALMQSVSDEMDWDLQLAEIARIWRGGCIIRSVFLDRITEAYKENKKLKNMLLAPYFKEKITEAQKSLRSVITTGITAGIPLPCHSAALNYYDGLRTNTLPANLLQAQRDYFGAHMYERLDKPRGQWFHTNWTGEGGDTTSTAYTE